jgi:hypothetical protein
LCGEPLLNIERNGDGTAYPVCDRGGDDFCEPAEVAAAFADDFAAEEDAAEVARTSAGRRAVLTTARRIESQRIRWAWRGRIPRRSMVVVAGEKGLGKSALTNAWLVARATRGELAGEFKGHPLDVLVLTAEDDWSSVVKPRLIAAGADLDRVHRLTVEDASGECTFTLPDDVPLVEQEIAGLRAQRVEVGMLVVDPIGAFLAERTDSHKDASVRRALAPLSKMAERLDLAVVVVAHLTKDEGKRLLARVSGSGAFVNAARSVLAVARDPNDPEGEAGGLRVLVHVASNWGRLAPALACHIEAERVALDDGSVESVPLWVIDGESSVSLEELQGGQSESRTEVEEEIAAVLAEGARPSRDVKGEVAKALGLTRKTVERHAVAMAERGELVIREKGEREGGANAPRRFTEWALADADEVGTRKQGHRDTPESVPTCSTRIAKPNPAPPESSRDTGPRVVPACSCETPGLPAEDGRCSRCWGSTGEVER